MLLEIQCLTCGFGNTLRTIITKDNFIGYMICSQYSGGIPSYVQEVEKDCPKYKEKT